MVDVFEWPEWKLPEELEENLFIITSLNKEETDPDEWMLGVDLLELYDYNFYLCYSHDNIENEIFPNKCWTFQHHCAFYSAPEEVIERLNELGFPMSLKDGLGRIPMDLVDNTKPASYKKLFEPESICGKINLQRLDQMDKIIHHIINERSDSLFKKRQTFVFPSLSVFFEWMNFHGNSSSAKFKIPVSPHNFYIEPDYDEDGIDIDAVTLSVAGSVYKIKENTYELIESVFS